MKGFGIKTSYKTVLKYKEVDKVLRHMRLNGSIPLQSGTNLLNKLISEYKNLCTTILNNDNEFSSSNSNSSSSHTISSTITSSNTSDIKIETSSDLNLLEYELRFHMAVATFKHQAVFDTRDRKVSLCDTYLYDDILLINFFNKQHHRFI